MDRVSQDSYPSKSIPREPGRLESKHAVKFSKGTLPQIKIRGGKGPSQGVIQKCEPHERSPCAPKFEERSHAEWHGVWRNIFTSSRVRTKLRFHSSIEA